MKKLIIAVAFILFAGIVFGQNKIDIEKEKEAIKAVIEEETDAMMAGDFARQSETYVQDETNVRLAADKKSYVYYVGWEDLSAYLKSGTEAGPESFGYTNIKYEKTDYRIKVYNKSAWAIFNDIWDADYQGESVNIVAIGIRFLEKVDGEWKIVYMSEVIKSSYENDDEEVGAEEGESGSLQFC